MTVNDVGPFLAGLRLSSGDRHRLRGDLALLGNLTVSNRDEIVLGPVCLAAVQRLQAADRDMSGTPSRRLLP